MRILRERHPRLRIESCAGGGGRVDFGIPLRYRFHVAMSGVLGIGGDTVEYTTELELLDEDTWHPGVHDFSQPEVTDQWGTANPMNELIAKESFNDPDRGVFIAPPI